jgi:hypothetical protein
MMRDEPVARPQSNEVPMIISEQMLLAYLDESLSGPQMAQIEQLLRRDASLQAKLAEVVANREAGVHGLGEIWRRHRLTCPTREQLGGYLLGALDSQISDYISFHLQTVQCRLCLANLDDLKQQSQESQPVVQGRRRKYFQTSAGFLSKGS